MHIKVNSDFISFHIPSAILQIDKGCINIYCAWLGFDPKGDISIQTLHQIIEFAHKFKINVICTEDLLDPRVANVIAKEIPNGKYLFSFL